MVKVYVVYIKLRQEDKPRVWASTDKSRAVEQKRDYQELNASRKKQGAPLPVTAIRMKTVEF